MYPVLRFSCVPEAWLRNTFFHPYAQRQLALKSLKYLLNRTGFVFQFFSLDKSTPSHQTALAQKNNRDEYSANPFRASLMLEAGRGEDSCATGSPGGRCTRSTMTRSNASYLKALAKYIISGAALTAQSSARTGALELLLTLSTFEWVAVQNNPDTSRQKRAV